jgi:hypothetical protein
MDLSASQNTPKPFDSLPHDYTNQKAQHIESFAQLAHLGRYHLE